MRITTLLCVAASALLLAGGASAHETGKPHKHRAQKAQTMKPMKPAKPKDPYAAYWNDPGRAAPPFSYWGQP
jgi:hypothetical protein